MAIVEAESTGSKRTRKSISHLEVHPKLGGGHMVRHVYSGMNQPKEYNFGKNEGSKAAAHIAKYAGLPSHGAAEPEDQEY